MDRRMASNDAGVLSNVDSWLRSRVKLERGVVISKVFPGYGTYIAKVESSGMVASTTIYPAQERIAYRVRYEEDNTPEDIEDDAYQSCPTT